ncbi:MAG: sodium:solute symporter [Candidatus Eremiobacteraeota bacterium]|nr:sodium:solute symporter [Candidatus Eremiobacteraeota bacterium]
MLDVTAVGVFVAFFALVTGLGFYAARWRRGDLRSLGEWGLGGRRFGVLVTWFLLGGDLYTAYTFIAVPAAMYGQGAMGFFALPYTVFVYPIAFVLMPRLWNVCRHHDWVTPADFVRGRYGSDTLALAVAVTGILATLPYIALQLVGMQAVIAALGIGGSGLGRELPLIVAFIILAAYTYTSGLRAPALIALVKDTMIYIVVIAALIVIPRQLGGIPAIFAAATHAFAAGSAVGHVAAAATAANAPRVSVILAPSGYWPYATLALGSAFALLMYPHSITGILAATRAEVIRRNAALLPLYSLLLGVLALFGFMAIAAHVRIASPTAAVPALLRAMFPSWFVGFAFAAIAIGALVPAAIMSIAAANLWTRNVYKAYLRRDASDAQQAAVAKVASLVVKLGALGFIIAIPLQYAIDLQLLGGIWILQTFPALALGLHRRMFHHNALLWGWAIAMLAGTWLSFRVGVKPTFPLHIANATVNVYIGLEALLLNAIVSAGLTLAFDRIGFQRLADSTHPDEYDDASRYAVPTTTLGTSICVSG